MNKQFENVLIGGNDYETVAAGQTDQPLGTNGGKNDLLSRLIITVNAAATSAVEIQDGTDTAIPILAANTPIGVYQIEIGARSRTGAWSVTTAAGVTVLAVGDFQKNA